MAGRANIPRKLRMDFAELGDFVHRSAVDFFLRVEAGAHRPFMEEMEKGASLDQADRFCIGKQIKSDFRRNPAIEKLILGGPSVAHGALIEFFGARILT